MKSLKKRIRRFKRGKALEKTLEKLQKKIKRKLEQDIKNQKSKEPVLDLFLDIDVKTKESYSS